MMSSHYHTFQKNKIIGLKRKIYINLERKKISHQSQNMMTLAETLIFNNMINVIENLEHPKSISDIINDLNELILTLNVRNNDIIDEVETVTPEHNKTETNMNAETVTFEQIKTETKTKAGTVTHVHYDRAKVEGGTSKKTNKSGDRDKDEGGDRDKDEGGTSTKTNKGGDRDKDEGGT